MDILQKIVDYKRKEVDERKELFPTALLEKSTYFGGKPVSLKKYLLREDKSGIIAEIKRKSPSKGDINPYVSVERTSIGYMQAGASALSILTDKEFFGGKNEDLMMARKFNFCPILRKDFMIDEYQVVEAKSIGADVILLIAAVLSPDETNRLAILAKSLGMEVLLEVHSVEELERSINPNIDVIGVNNRNLKTFEVSLQNSIDILPHIPSEFVAVSESGIRTVTDISFLKKAGFKGFLIGENFMTHSRPEIACKEFIEDIKRIEKLKS
ncbi:indole-3-glycerol phosphate synthase TrpC [Fulvivirgaceae bacterium LMO-SS25]